MEEKKEEEKKIVKKEKKRKREEDSDDEDITDEVCENENINESDDENWNDDSWNDDVTDENSDDDDDDDENESENNNDENDILKSLLLFSQYKQKEKQKNDREFLPSLQNFFKANIKKRHQMYNGALAKKIQFLAKNILNRKIPIYYSHEYKYVLHNIAQKKKDQTDIKILLCEDQCLSGIFDKALKLIKKSKK